MQKNTFFEKINEYIDIDFFIIFIIFIILFILFFYYSIYYIIDVILLYIIDNSIFIFKLFGLIFKNYTDIFILYAIVLNVLFYFLKLFFLY